MTCVSIRHANTLMGTKDIFWGCDHSVFLSRSVGSVGSATDSPTSVAEECVHDFEKR